MLGGHLAIEEALSLFRAFRADFQAVAREGAQTASIPDGLALRVALLDVYAMCLISIVLGFSNAVAKVTAESFGRLVEGIDWGVRQAIYVAGLPRAAIQELESLQKELEFERETEGKRLSPLWYQKQMVALAFSRFLAESANNLVAEFEAGVVEETNALVSAGTFAFAAQLIQRGRELADKLSYHLREVKGCFERLSTFRRVADIPWPSVDWTKLADRVRGGQVKLIEALAQLVPPLAVLPRPADLPDYFGQAYATLAQESYSAMRAKDESLFKKLFPPFFLAGLSAFDQLRSKLGGYDPETSAVYITEPIADLLELSGYAIIYSELDGGGYWDIAKQLWDKHFARVADSNAFLALIATAVRYRASLFAIKPRDLARTAWKQDYENNLRERGLLEDPLSYRLLQGSQAQLHPSAIIRALTRGGHSLFVDAADVFVVQYLMERPEAKQTEWTRAVRDFAFSLKRELLREDHLVGEEL